MDNSAKIKYLLKTFGMLVPPSLLVFCFWVRTDDAQPKNFSRNDLVAKNITSFIVNGEGNAQRIKENSQILSYDKIYGTDSYVIKFDSPQSAEQTIYNPKLGIEKNAIESNVQMKILSNDPYFSSQQNLTDMDVPDGWNALDNSSSVVVAVVDTGVAGNHEDLQGQLVYGYNFISNQPIIPNTNTDTEGHGTQVASIIAAKADNGVGMAGVAYRSPIMPVKVMSGSTGDAATVSAGVRWAVDNGANVINLSLGGSYSPALHSAISYAKSRGIIVVAASGNENSSLSYPASDSLVISVGSIDASGYKSSFSNYGAGLSVVAPGENIRVANRAGGYTTGSGTSFSCAEVSGIAALSMAWHQGESIDQIESYIKSSAIKTSEVLRYPAYYGNGKVSYKSLQVNTGSFEGQFYQQSGHVTIGQGETKQFFIQYKNTGKTYWRRDTVKLGLVDNDFNYSSYYPMASNWLGQDRPATLSEASVAPGEVGTFTFHLTNNGIGAGSYRLNVGLVADGITWFPRSTHAYWDVRVNKPFDAAYYDQSPYTSINQGETKEAWIRFRNTGATTWNKYTVKLGLVDNDFNYSSYYPMASNWLGQDRPATLSESSVAPGELGTFRFNLTNNGIGAGSYRLYTGLVADGITWFPRSTHAYWDVNVNPQFQGEVVDQSNYPTVNDGTSQTVTIKYRNTGSATWQQGVVKLGLVDSNYNWIDYHPFRSDWYGADRPATLAESSVAPGEVGTFTFHLTNNGIGAGSYRLNVGLVADGITWFPRSTHAYWNVYVD